MTHLESLEQQLRDIDEQLLQLLPTPMVGTIVQWFLRGVVSPEAAKAAIVCAVEEPGRVKLTIFPPNGMLIHKQGVLHASHPMHQQSGNASTVNNGSWDYKPDDKPSKNSSHWKPHHDQLSRRRSNVLNAINDYNAKTKQIPVAGAVT